jgi:hypothetical protein
MIDPDEIDKMAARIWAYASGPGALDITEEQAGDMAAEIGDTPVIDGATGSVLVWLDAREFAVPRAIVFPEA